ncbi:hypothetical protein ACFL21_00025 [Patescibacteria group bacterium]
MIRKVLKIWVFTFIIIIGMGATAVASELSSQFEEIEDQLVRILDNDPTATDCRVKLVPIYDAELIQFFDFLDQTFKNKSSTSSLSNLAIAKYRLFKKGLEKQLIKLEYSTSEDAENVALYQTEFEAYSECSQITDVYVALAKQRMIEHIQTTNYQKKTSMLAEKYKSINSKMRDLDFEVAQMYAFYLTFKNKLPGFLSECITN